MSSSSVSDETIEASKLHRDAESGLVDQAIIQ